MIELESRTSNSSPDLSELADLLREKGILYSTSAQPILGRDGSRANWMLYSYAVTLTAQGGKLVADALLPILRSFRARQLVSVGYTAMPVLSACILHSQGEFRGACVRETTKKYGSCRRIEGLLDRTEPVLVVDDSISSGYSIRSGISALEAEGYEVEGAVGLVHFPWRGGAERARAHGYRVETVLDIYRDIGMPIQPFLSGYRKVSPLWSDLQADAGLSPAALAREVAREYLRTGRVLRSPSHLDGVYDCSGGVFISFRDHASEMRLARDGYWHFEPKDADCPRDVVLATAKTVTLARERLLRRGLENLKIAVSFLGALRKVEPSELDFLNLGIVVRSEVQPSKMGGALPNTQIFTSEIEQYRHAALHNARLGFTEPHELFVHTIEKHLEPGEYWLPYGTPPKSGELDPGVGERLTSRASDALAAELEGRPLDGPPVRDDELPEPVYGVGVTLYDSGVVGCSVSWSGSLDDCLVRATRGAAADRRFRKSNDGIDCDAIAICISVLRDRELLSTGGADGPLHKARLGEDSVGVKDGRKHALFLPQVAIHQDWNKKTLAQRLLRKANIESHSHAWMTFRTSSWLRSNARVYPIAGGFPQRDVRPLDEAALRDTLAVLCTYIIGQIRDNGIPAYSYSPVFGLTRTHGTLGRVLHALTAVAEAGEVLERPDFTSAVKPGIQRAIDSVDVARGQLSASVDGYTSSNGADAELLLGAVALRQSIDRDARMLTVYDRLREMLRLDGRVDPSPDRRLDAEHDLLPGLILLAVTACAESTGDRLDLSAQLSWYSTRFDLLKSWGMIGWHPQAWLRAWQAGWRSNDAVALVRRMADWAMKNQHGKGGAFLTDMNKTGPSFHTALVMEGMADAAALLRASGDRPAANACMESWKRGAAFMDRLIIRKEDTFCMSDPQRAIGGVRSTLTSTQVRIDFVSHTVQAIVKGLRYQRAE